MPALPSRTGLRDHRIDIFRGMALVMIFINHMPAHPWHILTLRSWGFADSAEVFVLLAGMASALAYGKWFLRGEFAVGAMAVGARIWTLYLTHLMLFLVIGAIAIFASERLNETTYLEALGFDVFLQAPANFLGHVLTLTFLPGYLDILPLYVVLLAGLPVIFWLAARHWALPLVVSTLLYTTAQFIELNLPNTRTAHEWFFNPAAWQLLFVIGFTIGQRLRAGDGPGIFAKPMIRHTLTATALAYTFAALVIAAPWRDIPGLENAILIDPAAVGTYAKTDLPLIRLADTLLKLWLVMIIVRPDARWLGSWPARMLGLMGKHSLEVFAFSTVIAIVGGIAITIGGFKPLIITGAVLGGTVLMILLASAIEWRERRVARLVSAGEKRGAIQGSASVSAPADVSPIAATTDVRTSTIAAEVSPLAALVQRTGTTPRATPLAGKLVP